MALIRDFNLKRLQIKEELILNSNVTNCFELQLRGKNCSTTVNA